MLRQPLRCLARQAPFISRPFPARNHRLISTAPPARKSRSWKSLAVRAGLAGGVVYYYNTSNLFAEDSVYAVPPPKPSSEETALPTLESLTESRQAKAPVPTLSSTPTTTQPPAPTLTPSADPQTTADPSLQEQEEEASQQGAFNEETGEINWDCPCLGGMAHGPCGEQFRAAFSCFVYSKEEPKGMDCIENFKTMQNCFREHPEEYGAELEDDDDDMEEGGTDGERISGMGSEGEGEGERLSGRGSGGRAVEGQTYANGEPLPEAVREGGGLPAASRSEAGQEPASSSSPAVLASGSLGSGIATEPSTGRDATQRAKKAGRQVQEQHGKLTSESEALVPKAAHDATGANAGE